MSPVVRGLARRDTYRDSVELMRIAAAVEHRPGVARAALMMGTPANRELLVAAGLLADDAHAAGPNDLIVALSADDAATAEAALEHAVSLLTSQPVASTSLPAGRPPPRTLADGLTEQPDASLAIISTPGQYATAEALKALKRGLHVFMFSDNVPIEDEVELKRLGRQKRLLVMGPDCGTAILDGVPIGFANAVRRGHVGLVGASGTGLQEVTCLIDRAGEGVSQAIGVGGRDLSERVGGLMMTLAIEWLADDPATDAIVLVSKPPAPAVAARVLDVARACGKPTIVCFLGGDPDAIRSSGLVAAATLEEAATLAGAAVAAFSVAAARPALVQRSQSPSSASSAPEDEHPSRTRERRQVGTRVVEGETGPDVASRPCEPARRDGDRDGAAAISVVRRRQGAVTEAKAAIRGLFSGGTLAQEATLLLSAELAPDQFSVVDLGADEYTTGRPHPMIDARLRNEEIVAAGADPSIGLVLLDVVLGYGAHADPAGALAPAIEDARQAAMADGRELVVVASVTGTAADPQGLAGQEATLAAAGVLLAPSNAAAARLAAALVVAGSVAMADPGGAGREEG